MDACHQQRRNSLRMLAMCLTFLFASLAPLPANAEDNGNGRPGAASQANDYAAACLKLGGEPDIEDNSDFGYITASCHYAETGYTDYCQYHFDGSRSCGGYVPLTPKPVKRPPIVAGGNDSAAQPGAPGSAVSALSAKDTQSSARLSRSGQDDEREAKKIKGKHGKNKKGKRGGTHRQR